MSNNQDLIQTLEKSVAEAQKNLRVLNAVKDADNFIVVTLSGNTVTATTSTATTSDGMNVSNAVASLAAAIRSYSVKLHKPDDVNTLLNIINAEVDQISDHLQDLIMQERADQEQVELDRQMVEPEVADYSSMNVPSKAPELKHPATKGVPHK